MDAIFKCIFVLVMLFGGVRMAAAQVSGNAGTSGNANVGTGAANVGAGVDANTNAHTGGTNSEAG